MIMSGCDTDSEIMAELANAGAGATLTLKIAYEEFGYDGYIVRGKYVGADIYVAFDSSQKKPDETSRQYAQYNAEKVYTKKNGNLEQYIRRAVIEDRIIFWDKKKSQELFNTPGLQLPDAIKHLDSDVIIRRTRAKVNTKNKNSEKIKFSLKKSDAKKDDTLLKKSKITLNPRTPIVRRYNKRWFEIIIFKCRY